MMLHRLSWPGVILACALLAGCQDRDLAIAIDSMTLYSLDGMYERGGKDEKPSSEMFHDYPVLGKIEITSPKDRTAILAAIKKGIADNDGTTPKCFWPRHGVRLTQNGKTIEYLICFQCRQLDVFTDGSRSHKLTTGSPAPVLNEHLDRGGIPRETNPDPGESD